MGCGLNALDCSHCSRQRGSPSAYPNSDVQVPLLAISLATWCYFSDGRECYYYYLDDGRGHGAFHEVWRKYCAEHQSQWRACTTVNRAWQRWVRRRRFKTAQVNMRQRPKFTFGGNMTFASYRRPTAAARLSNMLRGMMRRATRYHCANTRTVVTAHPTAPATACHWSAVVRHHTRGRSTHRQKQPHKRAVADWLLGGRSVAADGDDAAELRQHLPSAGDEIDGAAASTASAAWKQRWQQQ